LDKINETSVAPKEFDTPEELALTEEICGAVNVAIEGLCEEQRTAIVLSKFQGLSYPQVARALTRVPGSRGDRQAAIARCL
jgi:DNA-directed RNA polymerase specialized sigma24 family protein